MLLRTFPSSFIHVLTTILSVLTKGARPPCTAADLGTIGTVSVTGTDDRTGISFEIGEDIYGPFEAGFSGIVILKQRPFLQH